MCIAKNLQIGGVLFVFVFKFKKKNLFNFCVSILFWVNLTDGCNAPKFNLKEDNCQNHKTCVVIAAVFSSFHSISVKILTHLSN